MQTGILPIFIDLKCEAANEDPKWFQRWLFLKSEVPNDSPGPLANILLIKPMDHQ